MSADACITSRAVSPRTTAIIQQQQRLRQQRQQYHHHQSSSYHAFDDGGASSSPLHTALVLGGSQGFTAAAAAAASQQHNAFNALRLPLGVDIVPSPYPVRGTTRSFDPQTYSSGYSRELNPLLEGNQSPSQTAPQDPSSMRYPDIDLPILNAETYSDGYQFKGGLSSRQSGSNSPPTDDIPTQRKRGRKNESVDENDIQEGKKRARGRPRLNPQDETAVERRRTQIRLAQRAYRHRKENAITELESQVRDLKEVNDEMRDVFQRLLESASRQGIAHAPDFGEHFLKLQTLIKRSREDGEGEDDDDDESLPEIEVEETGGGRGSQQTSAKIPSMQGSDILERRCSQPNQPEHLYGLIVTHEPVAQHQQPHTTADQTYPAMSMPMHQHHDPSNAYQIIAAPTLENASFAGTNTSFLFSNSTATTPASSASWTFTPWSTLPIPASVAYQELTFARRLHRYATERAAYLICLKDPPQEKMTRVFGFARLFETTDMIRERTLAVLARSRDQSLQNWNYPFYNLGGAGTHFPGSRKDDSGGGGGSNGNGNGVGIGVGVGIGGGNGLGNAGNMNGNGIGGGGGGDHHQQTRGFRFGPMDEPTSHIRDSLLTISQNIRMPGLQGLFWDCDEVEWYMRQNGVVIPDAAADYCSVEVPAGSFFQYQEVRHREADPGTPVSLSGGSGSGSVFTATGPDVLGVTQQQQHQQQGMSTSLAPPDPQLQHSYASSHIPVTGNGNGQHIPIPGGSSSTFMGKVVQLNVSKFLDRLTSRAACLGRTPGFRPKDVDASFWESVITGPG